MQSYDAVICGAGVGGLALAAALGRAGRRVLLVDKQHADVVVHKGELLQPRTLYILEALGALPTLRARGALPVFLFECRASSGELIGALDYQLLDQPFNYGLLHYYHAIKDALLAAAGNGVEVRFRTRVAGLLRDADGRVTGVRIVSGGIATEVHAPLTVAADGRTSLVRREAGIEAEMFEYPHQLLAFDMEQVEDLGPRVSAFLTPAGLRLLYPLPGRRARLYVQLRPDEFRAIKQRGIASWIEALVATTPGLQHVASQLLASAGRTQVLPAWRFCAPVWTVPGLALVGDAAHCVHPMAGQGMNAAIADAWLLSEYIREAGEGPLTPSLVGAALARYEQGRRPQLEFIIRLSHSLSVLFTDTSPLARLIGQRVLRSNRFNRRLQYLLTYNMSGLGVRRFTWMDRIYQFGILPDPRASHIGL